MRLETTDRQPAFVGALLLAINVMFLGAALAQNQSYNPFPGKPDPLEVAAQLGYETSPSEPWPPHSPAWATALTHPAVQSAWRARYGDASMDQEGRRQPRSAYCSGICPCSAEIETTRAPTALEKHLGRSPILREVLDAAHDPGCAGLLRAAGDQAAASAAVDTRPLPRPAVKVSADTGGLRVVLQVPDGSPYDGWEASLDTGVFARRSVFLAPAHLHYLPAESGVQRVRVRATNDKKRGSWSEWTSVGVAMEPPPPPEPKPEPAIEPTLCLSISAQELHGPGPWTVRAVACGGGR